MQYVEIKETVKQLDFIKDDSTADAAVKGVLNMLASAFEEPEARLLSEALREPLSIDKPRGEPQARPLEISVDDYLEEIGRQFSLEREQSYGLVRTVLHLTKDAVGAERTAKLKTRLPADWATLFEIA